MNKRQWCGIGALIGTIAVISCLLFLFRDGSTQWQFPSYYYQMATMLSREEANVSEGYVYFLGDSHIQGLTTQEIVNPSINLGLGHDTIEGLRARLGGYQALRKASSIVIGVGFNDLNKQSLDGMRKSYQDLFEALPKDIPILVSLLFKVDEALSGREGVNGKIEHANAFLLRWCQEHDLYYCLRPFSETIDGHERRLLLLADGVHLNPVGYSLWIDSMAQFFGQEPAFHNK